MGSAIMRASGFDTIQFCSSGIGSHEVILVDFEVAGTFGRAILELCSDDEGPSTEAHGLVIIEVLGQRSRNEVLAEIYMIIFFSRLLEPLEKQFLRLGVMTKVQAQRHMDDPAIIEVPGQRSHNEVLAEIYMQFLSLGVMTKVQAQRHMDDPAIIEVLGQRSHNEVLAEIYMTIFFSRLLEPLEKQFLSLGVMTKVQAQRYIDDLAIIEVIGQRSCNEVLAEIYMVAGTFGKAILEVGSDDEGPSTEAHG
ncbi:uncharacterized protein LOC122056627 [Zingiber officinale]|uniref:uncharacterized protein LOC122056627 n=1 Tax=Zingiber officinale TaxID=94328 RepID=UPI001C4C9C60|nr:uncharacterized protein LOC122056627 [Zingiber officinale]